MSSQTSTKARPTSSIPPEGPPWVMWPEDPAPRAALVLALDDRAATLPRVGGKGASLARRARAGLPVPAGFLVTTEAYRAFIEANGLQAPILALARDSGQAGQDNSDEIRALVEGAAMPPEVSREIGRLYADLTQATGATFPLAVRSSATAEDLPGASFAGQHDSFLNVRGEAALLEAVRRCWSSPWTTRAMHYRAAQGVDSTTVWMAVVVQRMVDAESSGVLFTANPLTGAREEIVLDASWGLGEAIVGGLVTPDHIVADKATDAIKVIRISDKAMMTVLTDAGTVERPVEESRRRAPVLTPAQLIELLARGRAVEALDGAPQDIEWCWAKGVLSIVQARPITALPPAPVPWPSPIAGAKWMKDVQTAEWAAASWWECPPAIAATSG